MRSLGAFALRMDPAVGPAESAAALEQSIAYFSPPTAFHLSLFRIVRCSLRIKLFMAFCSENQIVNPCTSWLARKGTNRLVTRPVAGWLTEGFSRIPIRTVAPMSAVPGQAARGTLRQIRSYRFWIRSSGGEFQILLQEWFLSLRDSWGNEESISNMVGRPWIPLDRNPFVSGLAFPEPPVLWILFPFHNKAGLGINIAQGSRVNHTRVSILKGYTIFSAACNPFLKVEGRQRGGFELPRLYVTLGRFSTPMKVNLRFVFNETPDSHWTTTTTQENL